MDKYYYLIAQLPTLYFDRSSEITLDQFMEEAGKWMSKKDFTALQQISLLDTAYDDRAPKIIKEYRASEYQFRTELAAWRKASKEGVEYKPENFPLSLVKEGNPLEIEKKLLAHRWAFLEEQEKDHDFDFEFVVLYYLKLQVLDKLSQFNKENGLAAFQKISKVTI